MPDRLLVQDVLVGHHVEGVLERGLGPALVAGLTRAAEGLGEREDVEDLAREAMGGRSRTQLGEPVVLQGLRRLGPTELPLLHLPHVLGVLRLTSAVLVQLGEEVPAGTVLAEAGGPGGAALGRATDLVLLGRGLDGPGLARSVVALALGSALGGRGVRRGLAGHDGLLPTLVEGDRCVGCYTTSLGCIVVY